MKRLLLLQGVIILTYSCNDGKTDKTDEITWYESIESEAIASDEAAEAAGEEAVTEYDGNSNQVISNGTGYTEIETFVWTEDMETMTLHNIASPNEGISNDQFYAQTQTEIQDRPDKQYPKFNENEFMAVSKSPVSTFSIDVDNAAYSTVRTFLNRSQLPPAPSVRIEEMVNYFDYNYAEPTGQHPFAFHTEMTKSPWNEGKHLLHVGIKGKSLQADAVERNNLVFLIDASGSMSDANKLPLLKKTFKLMLKELHANDRIAIVAYAGAAGLVLPSTKAKYADKIIDALDDLEAGGSTAGGAGIELAYKIVKENFIKNGNNRVILATDGDFNVGNSSTNGLVELIENKRKEGAYLTICGFGMGNYKDYMMEEISNAGNGNYFYIDNIREAKKVFVDDLKGNLFTIAKDVKIQIEFNPTHVKSYRLVGYENRVMRNEDFDDDTKDAGELGAGHTVTALYELELTKSGTANSDRLRYQKSVLTDKAKTNEVALIKFRYKPPRKEKSILIQKSIGLENKAYAEGSSNLQFASAVAGFGMLLRNSKFKGALTYDQVLKTAKNNLGKDRHGFRQEFTALVEQAMLLSQ